MHEQSKTRFRLAVTGVASLLVVTATVVIVLLVGSASASSKLSASKGGGYTTPPPPLNTSGKKGGSITVALAGDVDSMDPGYAYYAVDYEVVYATERPLYSYKADSSTVVPDLATAKPTITNGGKTVTVHLKSGVKFSPPVNREVTSADVKYAIERGFAANVANGYATSYFAVLKGAPKKPAKTPAQVHISGIATPDAHTIVFHLSQPSGAFVGALVMPLTMPVPEEYAKTYDAGATSSYGQHVVATGPYMVKNDASGDIKPGWNPGVSITLVRNPNWDSKTDFRPAYLDQINFKEGVTDPTVMARQILAGSIDANGDQPPSPAELKSIISNPSQKKQLFFTPVSGSRYVALNTTKAPFNNVHVRRAVAYVLDRRAMLLTRGGPIDGTIATHFIDPSFAGLGFEAGGGFSNQFATPNDAGSVPKAEAELKKAGFSSGKYTGPSVSMVSDNAAPGSLTAQVVVNNLAKIGIKVNNHPVQHQTMYSKYCSVPSNAPNICPNVGWLQDFKDPQTILYVPFNGASIAPSNSSNWPQLNDPKINKEMTAAAALTSVKARAKAWGAIDKQITALAAAVPWDWENFPVLFSSRVVPAIQTWNEGDADINWISIK